jgi:quercetin dioxygenase-like cupin family protein
MKITSRQESMQLNAQSEPDRFTGEAAFRVLHTSERTAGDPGTETRPEDAARGQGTWNTFTANVSMVRYEPGSRTYWHSHSGGQMLYVVEGAGWVQTRGEPPRRVEVGDAISFSPGEVHWHGAAGDGAMAHIAVTTGRPSWYEEAQAPSS